MKHVAKLWVLVGLFAALSVTAFASPKEKKKTITITQQAQVAGTQLKPGDYQLRWENNGSQTTNVTFYRGKEAVVTVPAQVVNQKNDGNADMEFNTQNGGYRLDRVFLSDQVLEFGGASGSASGSGQ
jgi:plastocyanin